MYKNKEMNILISVNSKYVGKACTTLFSLTLYNSVPIHVYLLNSRLNFSEVNMMRNTLNKYSIHLTEINMDSIHLFDNLTLGNSHFSREMYYRIVAHLVLPSEMDRILWLDADIIINGDVTQFYYQELNNIPIVVSADSQNDSELIRKCKKNIGMTEDECYFNSGVMLLNLKYIREKINMELIDHTCKILANKLTYPDQDILNYIYRDSKKVVDWREYNYQVCGGIGVNYAECSRAKIIHYTSEKKPWDYKYQNIYTEFYWRIRIREGFVEEYELVQKKAYFYCKYRIDLIFSQYKKLKYYFSKVKDLILNAKHNKR
ncbi:glycosyltransferase family 8 protein [Anaerostipes faecalis]|uniref:glycosyltransferase family 8 protein n=1 Tax=Anaerostipes faecalis TaxID=2738446 RepID=UPI003F121209